jgi:hypothetical protein
MVRTYGLNYMYMRLVSLHMPCCVYVGLACNYANYAEPVRRTPAVCGP